MTAASYRKPCLTRWSWVVNRSCQAHLEHQPARQIRWHLSRALPRCFQDPLIGVGKRRSDQVQRQVAPQSSTSARPPVASRSVCHHPSIYTEGKMPTLCACGDWHPTRRLPEAGGRRWQIVATNGIGLNFCATCVWQGHKFAQKWTLFGVVVFVQHYATKRFLVGGTVPLRLRSLLRIWQLQGYSQATLIGISGVNYEKNGGRRRIGFCGDDARHYLRANPNTN